MNYREQEELFLTLLGELIEAFHKNKISDRNLTINKLSSIVNEAELAATTVGTSDSNIDYKFSHFIKQLETTKFYQDIIPYDKITECVFENTPAEMLYSFTNELRIKGETYFQEKRSNVEEEISLQEEITFLKIIRHIDLALIQKNSIATIKLREMDELKREHSTLKQNYNKLKDEADRQYKNMLTQYISILGVFAAILMGSFGAIQGFSNLFTHADKIPLGKLLIISSMGASSVLLILFFLLNGIAKLTGRSLSSSDPSNSTLLERHPTIVLSHGILVGIALIGTALSLSNIHLQFAWQGIWWLLPLTWIIYFLIAINKKDFFFFLKRESLNKNNKKNT